MQPSKTTPHKLQLPKKSINKKKPSKHCQCLYRYRDDDGLNFHKKNRELCVVLLTLRLTNFR